MCSSLLLHHEGIRRIIQLPGSQHHLLATGDITIWPAKTKVRITRTKVVIITFLRICVKCFVQVCIPDSGN